MKDSRRAFPRVLLALIGATMLGRSRAYLPRRYNIYSGSICGLRCWKIQTATRSGAFVLFSSINQNQNLVDGSEDEISLRAQFNQQQKQIDLLMQLLQNQQQSTVALEDAPIATNFPSRNTSPGSAPCKVMIFIDGTWLYYSLHERREHDCPLIKQYGKGWQKKLKIDWEALPRILCEKLQDHGWRSATGENHNSHYLEVVRASVFTSYKADTSPFSLRYQMFEEMKAANYDVHMMETVGKGEKCVDIQLAVEMLHYATVPHAYDIALLLTGDKDFMPAMIRTRQKGRKVGLVSMKRSCNRALFETDGVKDFEVCWMEDFLDEWIKPRDDFLAEQSSVYSKYFFARILKDFVQHSGLPSVSSRDLGRYLKYLRLARKGALFCVLDEMKSAFGGLSKFLARQYTIFEIHQREDESVKEDTSDRAYFVSLRAGTDSGVRLSQYQNWSAPEQEFFRRYSTEILTEQHSTAYAHSLLIHNETSGSIISTQPHENLPHDLIRDYGLFTLKDLKDRCRERKLPVSGVKSKLLERIKDDNEKQISELLKQKRSEIGVPNVHSSTSFHSSASSPEITKHLRDLVFEYVKASGGIATSRDVGRYLAANRASANTSTHSRSTSGLTALQELKDSYGSLVIFILQQSDLFVTKDDESDGELIRSIWIELKRR